MDRPLAIARLMFIGTFLLGLFLLSKIPQAHAEGGKCPDGKVDFDVFASRMDVQGAVVRTVNADKLPAVLKFISETYHVEIPDGAKIAFIDFGIPDAIAVSIVVNNCDFPGMPNVFDTVEFGALRDASGITGADMTVYRPKYSM